MVLVIILLMKNFKLITLIFLFALGIRLWGLGTYPPGPTNDEVSYFYNGYSIAETGRNIFGEKLPFFTNLYLPFMPVSTYLVAFFVKLLGLSLFSSRLPFVILGALEIPVLYLLVRELFGDQRIALFSALALAISPWHFHESRAGYEAIPSLFFILSGILSALWAARKHKSLFLSFPFFVIALFTYRAHNILFVPIFLSVFWYIFPLLKNNKKEILSFWLGVFLTLSLFVATFVLNGKSYSGELVFSKDKLSAMSLEIDNDRSNSSAPEFLNKIFINKGTLLYRGIRDNYMAAFSTNFLFTGGEGNGVRSTWFRGSLFTIEAIFLILGFLYLLGLKERRGVIFIFLLLLIGPLPIALSYPSLGMRAMFMLPFLMVLVSSGWLFLIDKIRTFSFGRRAVVLGSFIIVYIISIFSYGFLYFYRYPIYASEWWFTGIRDGFSYLDKNIDDRIPIFIASDEIYDVLQYSFFHKTKPELVQGSLSSLNSFQNRKDVVLGNTHFVKNCREDDLYKYALSLKSASGSYLMLSEKCVKPKIGLVKEIKERGSIRTVWWIYKVEYNRSDKLTESLRL